MNKVPALWIRGGTSKGLFLNEHNLPEDLQKREKMLLSMIGSPDVTGMQLNGMGGGISSTSKVALIKKSDKPHIDVDYLFGQVNIKEPRIDWEGSCGNLAAAVGLYSIDQGIVKPNEDGFINVNIWQTNLGYEIRLKIASENSKDKFISIPGVPGTDRAISVEFINPSSSLLPENKPVHLLKKPNGKEIEATLVLGANPTIFVKAKDLGLSGKELPEDIDFSIYQPLLDLLCEEGASIMQIPLTAALRIAWVAPSTEYLTSEGLRVQRDEVDILSRITTEGRVHHAYTGTGAINLACVSKIEGTIPNQVVNKKKNAPDPLRLGHPKGVMQINAKVYLDKKSNCWIAESASFMRTARILMKGDVYF